ncbi:hypothetical protein KAFR_0D00610 [Kazachstania africana CBS 2517]|uniref:PH domain-containing protein n=1 Tax=Kazachstania africana (strain ATCC 22294 / BCRC 22015 / CBS 2517 / CECT 1963 / NBRC 1671 / NRRL Y-8276) TaxID=1071382 RepID=H2ATK8_KAZAF|nr:hypothetical protein KAFR_0D00610 [Kazachstania africana CBS 2517]CCF57708.1 hypothetical protein KAFR_0D00610 [Kazachstania africana CBS 2517]
MKRIFSGAKSPKLPNPSSFFQRDASESSTSSSPRKSHSRASSFAKRLTSGDSSQILPQFDVPIDEREPTELSPELVPIVTLLSSQAHRRYHKGVILLLHDLKNDGSAASRKWKEVYAVLLGTQLALWDAKELSDSGSNSENRLKDLASRPTYINFSDATLRLLNSNDDLLSGKSLENTVVVSTTLKNRYFIQFSDKRSLDDWYTAIRLSLYENISLQEAYTGAFLSSRGSNLGDIKNILAPTNKFDHEDWVSVRFGAGMPWKRCYAVVSQQNGKKSKDSFGRINFYENDNKLKKANIMASVTECKAAYAVYPSSPVLIDASTILKLQGTMSFEKDEEPQETVIFIMPEKHQGVPGYDTIIRFLIPVLNAFRLYGRPEKLIASRDHPNSLLFALPTLPHVHYLQTSDILPFVQNSSAYNWTAKEWNDNIKDFLQQKLLEGYTGCGSKAKIPSFLSSPNIPVQELFRDSNTFLSSSDSSSTVPSSSPVFLNNPPIPRNSFLDPAAGSSVSRSRTSSVKRNSASHFDMSYSNPNVPNSSNTYHTSSQMGKSDLYDQNRGFNSVDASFNDFGNVTSYKNGEPASDLHRNQAIVPKILNTYESSYEKYMGINNEEKKFQVPNIRDSVNPATDSDNNSFASADSQLFKSGNGSDLRIEDELNELANRMKGLGNESVKSDSTHRKLDVPEISETPSANKTISNLQSAANPSYTGEQDIFNSSFMEQDQMMGAENSYMTQTYNHVPTLNGSKGPTSQIKSFPHSRGIKNLKNVTALNDSSHVSPVKSVCSGIDNSEKIPDNSTFIQPRTTHPYADRIRANSGASK